MPARKIQEVLARSGELRAVSVQAQRLAKLQQVLLEALPSPLNRSARVSTFRAGRLVVLADNAAIAAKLRQMAPRLLRVVKERENQVTGIHVDVQVAVPQGKSGKTPVHRDLSLAAVSSLEGLAGTLKESPLKGALERLVRRRKQVTRGGG
jgi:hypothetical protein